ncbi:hypothetical protein EON65_19785 [archaeon]|nr:MAG: hypothetical protein EON65_19785 [archaeon]
MLKGEASGSVFLQRVKHMANTALLENYNTAAQARNAFVKRALDKVQDHLRLQLEAIALNVALEADSSLDYCDEDERKKTKDVLCEISKQYLNLDSSVEELALASLAISAAETEADLEITEIL